jgi:hypothetical protein
VDDVGDGKIPAAAHALNKRHAAQNMYDPESKEIGHASPPNNHPDRQIGHAGKLFPDHPIGDCCHHQVVG